MRSTSASGAAVATADATPIRVRGRFLTAVVLPVAGPADEGFWTGLDTALATSPRFFANAPLVLDVERADGLDGAPDFRALLDGLRKRGLTPIGIQGPSERQGAAAMEAGLVTLPEGRDAPLNPPRRPSAQPPEPAPARATAGEEAAPATRLITRPVRSGQRIFSERGDVVVLASVSSGAEIIAHGNVHVYGALRGRALAGVNGDRTARIFCQSLEAELIAIAGLYKTSEDIDPGVRKTRVQAYLDEDALCIAALK